VLAALMHRAKTGTGQHVDIAMLDSMVALCDYIPNFWSLGVRKRVDVETRSPGIITTCRANNGWFVLHALRKLQFERLANIVGCRQWLDDPRMETLTDWAERLEDTIVPAINKWAQNITKQEAAPMLA